MTPTALILAGALFVCQSPGITDGDTLRCQEGNRVRIWGIDAVEAHTPLGPAATRAMARIIGGQTLKCEVRGDPSYGRTVAQCWTPDGTDIAAALMRTGLAQDCPRYSKGAYSNIHPLDSPVLPPRHKSCEVRR